MTDFARPVTRDDALLPIDRATAEALGYRCVTASEYAEQCADETLLRQLQDEGLL